MIQAEARDVSARVTRVIRAALGALSVEDRMIVRMRFDESVTIADISRMLRLPQRPLYRRIESLLGKLRRQLAGEGIDASAIADVLESRAADELDFGLEQIEAVNGGIRQTKEPS